MDMKEHPALFRGEMVRALLAGKKTQTRRLVTPAPELVCEHHIEPWDGDPDVLHRLLVENGRESPYGKPGDRMWVREAFAKTCVAQAPGLGEIYVYRDGDNRTDYGGPWKPSIHMPRRACRILLEVIGVRVERLNNISDADCIAEGCPGGRAIPGYGYNATPFECYKWLWESIYGAGSWKANPWVWVIEFRRLS